MRKQSGGTPSKLISLFKQETKQFKQDSGKILEVDRGTSFSMGAMPSTVSTLLHSSARAAKNRQAIYDKYAEMEANPFVNTALWLQTTAALGGHETTGEVVFIEARPDIKDGSPEKKIVEDIQSSLTRMINDLAFPAIYTGAAFGDSYARIYSEPGKGVVDLYYDELMRPELVQPYEQGSTTMGYTVTTGRDNFERLTRLQCARMKLPRISWTPQFGVVEKSAAETISNDNVSEHVLLPSAVGGSFLAAAEPSFDLLQSSLAGLVGQRWLDSIDEQIMTLDMSDMTPEQQKEYTTSIVSMLQFSKDAAQRAVSGGKPFLERVKHILPVWGEKQMQNLSNLGQSGRTATISIEDIMMHAKSLAGSLGTDLSMLGFADQLSGGLGDGGFFRVSAQAAERSRLLRIAFERMAHHIIKVHCVQKFESYFPDGEEPWKISYYSTISALAAEQARTNLDSANSAQITLQVIQSLKDAGTKRDAAIAFLRDEMQLDEDRATVYVDGIWTGEGDGGGNEFI